MGFYGILYVEKDSLNPICHKSWQTRQVVWRERQTLSNQGAQSRAPRRWRGRQAAEGMKLNRDISQACAAWDFFSKVSKMPRIKGEKMLKMPRMGYGNRIIDYPCATKGRHKVIFMRIHFVSKKPLVVRIVSIEKEVTTS
jgi:hypothetical protein